MVRQKRRLGCLSIIGALAVVLISLPLAFYLTVYMLARRSGKLPNWLQGRIDEYYFPTYISPKHAAMVPNFIAAQGPHARILNIGGGYHNYGPNIVNIELRPTPTTHVAADAHILPFADASFDAAFSTTVFEHLAQPWLATAEVERVLKPGGAFYIEVAFLQPYQGDPEDFYRFTISGLRSMLRNFEEQDSGLCNGPGSMLNWILIEMLGVAADIDGDFDQSRTHISPQRFLRARELGRLIFTPIKYLDKVLNGKEHSYVVASGIYFSGVKRPNPFSLSVCIAAGSSPPCCHTLMLIATVCICAAHRPSSLIFYLLSIFPRGPPIAVASSLCYNPAQQVTCRTGAERMNENGQRQRQLDDYAADVVDADIVSESGPAERIITDADAAREIAADVAEDDPEVEYKLSVYRYEEQPEDAFAPVDFSRIGEQAKPKRGRSVGDYIVLLLLIAIPVAIGLLLLAVSQNQKEQANQPANAPATAVPAFYSDKIAIVSHDISATRDGSGAAVNITVRNSGDQPVQVVSVQVRAFDESNKQVGSAGIVTISNIAPGELGRGSTVIKTDRPIDQSKTEFRVTSVLVPNVPTMSIEPSPTIIGGGNR